MLVNDSSESLIIAIRVVMQLTVPNTFEILATTGANNGNDVGERDEIKGGDNEGKREVHGLFSETAIVSVIACCKVLASVS